MGIGDIKRNFLKKKLKGSWLEKYPVGIGDCSRADITASAIFWLEKYPVGIGDFAKSSLKEIFLCWRNTQWELATKDEFRE